MPSRTRFWAEHWPISVPRWSVNPVITVGQWTWRQVWCAVNSTIRNVSGTWKDHDILCCSCSCCFSRPGLPVPSYHRLVCTTCLASLNTPSNSIATNGFNLVCTFLLTTRTLPFEAKGAPLEGCQLGGEGGKECMFIRRKGRRAQFQLAVITALQQSDAGSNLHDYQTAGTLLPCWLGHVERKAKLHLKDGY